VKFDTNEGMLSLKTKSQDIVYLTGRELGYPVSDLAGLCNCCSRNRSGGISLGGIWPCAVRWASSRSTYFFPLESA